MSEMLKQKGIQGLLLVGTQSPWFWLLAGWVDINTQQSADTSRKLWQRLWIPELKGKIIINAFFLTSSNMRMALKHELRQLEVWVKETNYLPRH